MPIALALLFDLYVLTIVVRCVTFCVLICSQILVVNIVHIKAIIIAQCYT